MKTIRLSLFGLPGAGKGTQAEMLRDHFMVPHISTGAMFRGIEKSSDPIALEIKTILASGRLVPDEIVTKLALKRLAEKDCAQGFILDGFPRTLPQAKDLTGSPFALTDFVILDVAEDIIIQRLTGRRTCASCQSIFHIDEMGERTDCPHDGGLLVQREDDRPEAVRIRLSTYKNNLSPVLSFYEERGLVRKVDGEGSKDAVFERILRAVS